LSLLAPAGETNDTWELAAADAPVINEHPASQIRLAGETATFRVVPSGTALSPINGILETA
jgi:hypothetical protein